MRSPSSEVGATGRTPAPMETDCMSLRTEWSLGVRLRRTAKPTLRPLQYMDQTGTEKRGPAEEERRERRSHSRAMRRMPDFISRARKAVGTANSTRKRGEAEAEARVSSWRQKLTRP